MCLWNIVNMTMLYLKPKKVFALVDYNRNYFYIANIEIISVIVDFSGKYLKLPTIKLQLLFNIINFVY